MYAGRMKDIPFSGIRDILEKCTKLERQGEDIIHLEIGRPDFDTPDPVKQAGIDAINEGYVHYTSNWGISELRDSIAEKFETDNGVSYSPSDEIVVTTGATEAVLLSVLAFIESGDKVLIPDPCWTYEPSIRMAGGDPVRYELTPEDDFQPNINSITDSISEDTKLLIVNSPHNPTGSVLSNKSMQAIRDLVVDNDLLLLSDEIYEKIIYSAIHRSFAAMDGLYDRTITLNGVSKAYSMTGWRVGYLGAPADLIDPIIRVRQYTSTCAPSMSQRASVAALKTESYEPMVEEFDRRRQLVLDRIDSIPDMDCPDPSGAFYAFPSIPDSAESAKQFVNDILFEASVATVPGPVFGPTGTRRFRIAYSNSYGRIDEAFDRIESHLEPT